MKCTVAELIGYDKHPNNMSHAEYLWWIARSSMKPLASVRELIYQNTLMNALSINHFSGKKMFSNSSINWYEISQKDIDEILIERVHRKQKELNEKAEREKDGHKAD